MTLRLTIDEQAWRAHVHSVQSATPGLVPVVKGNGYGFGRATLARHALALADEIAVGTVHELGDLAQVAEAVGVTVVALTPTMHLPTDLPHGSVPTVGAAVHLEALLRHGWDGPVAVKLESSMHRHGSPDATLETLLQAIDAGGLSVHQLVLHLPLTSPTFPSAGAIAEVERWIERLDQLRADAPLSLSHLPADSYRDLCAAHPERSFRLRVGTALWHGDKSDLHLAADVLEVRPVTLHEPLGYRQAPASTDGHVVMIGAGSAHGVVVLDGGLSPYHHDRRRLALVEPPHMHTSMVVIPDGEPVPAIGDWVDVQQPLINVDVDEWEWR